MNPGGDKLLCPVHAPLYEPTPTIPADTTVADEENDDVLGE